MNPFKPRSLGRFVMLLSAISWLAGMASVHASSSATNVFSFDDPSSMNTWWINGWGGQGAGASWDGTQDHTGNGGGSLHVVDTLQNGDQLVDLGWWSGSKWSDSKPIDLSVYNHVIFYLKWDNANSSADATVFQSTGEPLKLWAVPTSVGGNYPWIELGPVTFPWYATNGWVRIDVPINPYTPGITNSAEGLGLKKYTGAGFTNTFAFWVDDFTIAQIEPSLVPVLSITNPVSGLNLYADFGPYRRESVKTVRGQSWIGQGTNPVIYSFTIKQGVAGNGGIQFQNHIFLVSNPGSETSPDWNETNVIFLDLESNTNGGGTTWTFRYKTNQYAGNSMFYDTNVVPAIASDTNLTGTWSVTFLNDTNVTMSTPNGSSTNFNLPIWLPPLFPDTVCAYFGVQANNSAAVGQQSVYREIRIAGTANPLDDVFEIDAALNSNLWSVVAVDPQNVFLVPPTSAFWVNWTLPDPQYVLAFASTPDAANWADMTGVTVRQLGAKKWALIDQSKLPGANEGYFRLVRRIFTQLQVLLPGETNAPGTASGKMGTPTPVSLAAGGIINVTVNACDAGWNIVNLYGDTIHLTSTDTQVTQPADTVMAGGTTVQQFQLKSQGSTTFTASDTIDVSIPSNTSSPVTVGP